MPENTTTYESEIAAGMDLLDDEYPGWENQVDWEKLDQGQDEWTNNDCGCVLVHVFGSYVSGMDHLCLDDNDVVALGFDIKIDIKKLNPLSPNFREYGTLTSQWKESVCARYGITP